ncbi:MAG: hypothetical protein M3N08_00230 [Pseudomonadota bacterium]|nr:hypothetical protein [Pseudomonadota bacterium]
MTRALRASAMAFLLARLLGSGAAAAETSSLSINDPRPVFRAVEHVEAIYGVPITYEDSVLAQPDETVTRGGARWIVRGQTLNFSYETVPLGAGGEVRRALAAKAIAEALRTYNIEHSERELFVLTDRDGFLHVVPTQFTDADGKPARLKDILAAPVSISEGEKSAAELLDAVAQSVAASTGVTVKGTGDETLMAMLRAHKTMIAARDEPARYVLDELIRETFVDPSAERRSLEMSWLMSCTSVLHDNGPRWCWLDLRPVAYLK